MTTDPRHHEPLDADERDLAARLGRIGPFDGPSPALDAKILAAAHAASVTKLRSSRRRWLAWVGVPPALITGVGVAAAAVLALGLVWQMRPRQTLLSASESAAADEEVFVMAPPMTATRPPVVNPPPFPQAIPQAIPTAPREPAEAREQVARAADAVAMAAPAAAPPAAPSPPVAEPAPSPAVRQEAMKSVAAAEADDVGTLDRCAGAGARANAATAGYTAPVDERAAGVSVAAQERAEDKAAQPSAMADAAGAIAASTTRRDRAAAPAAAPAPGSPQGFVRNAPAPPLAKAKQEECGPQLASADSTELDRVVVTGSRISFADIPARQDAKLGRDAWLQRIHERREAGDLRGAKESLRLFRRQYPHVRIPSNLMDLQAAPRQ
ncbi:hypothetical protein [Lysobacter fragariae]